MFAFWDSVADLRRIELIALLVGMLTPILCGTLLLTVRARIKNILTLSSQSQGFLHEESERKWLTQKQHLETNLAGTQQQLQSLRRATAPRSLTESDADGIVERLHGVKGAPVIVSASSYEDESYTYAEQIAGALKAAGWDVTLNKASMNDFKGVSLGTVNLMRRPLAGLHELTEALKAAHVDVRQREISSDSIAGPLQDGCLLVVVGRK